MGALARHLEVSVVYVSDVERCNRAPMTPPRIIKTAELLGIDPGPLLKAAYETRGVFEVKADEVPSAGREFLAALGRGDTLSDETWAEILALANKAKTTGEK